MVFKIMLSPQQWISICQERGYFLPNKEWSKLIPRQELLLAYINESGATSAIATQFYKALAVAFGPRRSGLTYVGPKPVPSTGANTDYMHLEPLKDWIDSLVKARYFKGKIHISPPEFYKLYCAKVGTQLSFAGFHEYMSQVFDTEHVLGGTMHYYRVKAKPKDVPINAYVVSSFTIDTKLQRWLRAQPDSTYTLNIALSRESKLTQETRDHLTQGLDINEAVKWYAMLNPLARV